MTALPCIGPGGTRAGNVAIAPIPTLSPSQGFGLKVIGQYIFKEAGQSEDTPSSIAGAGLRFRVAKSHPVNLRFDWADGDESCFYLGVTEAF